MKMAVFLLFISFFYWEQLSAEESSLIDDPFNELNPVVDIGPISYKNIKKSNFNWDKLDHEKLLSFKLWKEDIDEKALYPDWENTIRERKNKELIGHFYDCNGTCRIDRGESFFHPQFRSNLYEGDEVLTQKDSYAWIILLDGTMIRLAPYSSITLNELNIGTQENFLNARVNQGNIVWLSRLEQKYKLDNRKETDGLFFPMKLVEAGPRIDEFVYNEARIEWFLDEPKTTEYQFERLNKEIEVNNKISKGKKTFAFIIMPNLTVMGYSPMVEIISILGGRSFIKLKTAEDLGIDGEVENDLEYQLRGYENKEQQKMPKGEWQEIDEKGRIIRLADDISMKVAAEILVSRIPSLNLAREFFFRDYAEILYRETYDRLVLAKIDGYRLWGSITPQENKKDDLYLRLEYLKEYFRRVETTNLLVAERFRERLKERGEASSKMEYGAYFFKKALEYYYTYQPYSDKLDTGPELNSTKKIIWKRMHGIQ